MRRAGAISTDVGNNASVARRGTHSAAVSLSGLGVRIPQYFISRKKEQELVLPAAVYFV